MFYTSTYDYLKALRNGDYIRFTQLIDYLKKKYNELKQVNTEHKLVFTADILVPLTVYELINAGIDKSDIEHFKILYQLAMDPELNIPSDKYYAITTLISAMAASLVYIDNKQESAFKVSILSVQPTKNSKELELETLLQQNLDIIASNTGVSDSMMKEQISVYIQEFSKELTGKMLQRYQEIKSNLLVFKHAELLSEYKQTLVSRIIDSEDDKLVKRYQLVNDLFKYLDGQTGYHEESLRYVKAQIEAIRKLEPSDFEESKFLNQIVAADTKQKITVFTTKGFTLFKWYIDSDPNEPVPKLFQNSL